MQWSPKPISNWNTELKSLHNINIEVYSVKLCTISKKHWQTQLKTNGHINCWNLASLIICIILLDNTKQWHNSDKATDTGQNRLESPRNWFPCHFWLSFYPVLGWCPWISSLGDPGKVILISWMFQVRVRQRNQFKNVRGQGRLDYKYWNMLRWSNKINFKIPNHTFHWGIWT